MTYPHVTQFETRALEGEALAKLACERRAARAPQRPTGSTRRIAAWLRSAGRNVRPSHT